MDEGSLKNTELKLVHKVGHKHFERVEAEF
jgi:hypothetical protein